MKSGNEPAALASPEYRQFIEDLKARVISARISAARAANRELILLYWDIGEAIVEKQRVLKWGESVVDRVSRDLQAAYPDTRGFSPRNLRDMKRFFLAYGGEAIRRHVVAKLPVEAGINDIEIRRHAAGQERIVLIIDTDFTPISDARGSAEFRRVAARNLLLKFWSETTPTVRNEYQVEQHNNGVNTVARCNTVAPESCNVDD